MARPKRVEKGLWFLAPIYTDGDGNMSPGTGSPVQPVEEVYPGTVVRAWAYDPNDGADGQCLVEWAGPVPPDWTSQNVGQAAAYFSSKKGRAPGPGEVS